MAEARLGRGEETERTRGPPRAARGKEEPESPTEEPRRGGGPPGFAGGDFRRRGAAMLEDPEVQRLMAVQRKSALDSRYAALFRSLNLTPDQLDKFKNLLVEKGNAILDVMSAAREQGLNRRSDRDAFNKLVADAQADVDASIRSTLGESAFNQYREYEQTLPQRAIANQLEQRLSYTSTPLTPDQSTQLVRILAAANPNQPGRNETMAVVANLGGVNLPGGAGRVTVTDAVINQSLGVLAGPQIDALRQIQQEQQAQAELNAAMRRRFQPPNTGTTDTPAGATGTAAPAATAPGGG